MSGGGREVPRAVAPIAAGGGAAPLPGSFVVTTSSYLASQALPAAGAYVNPGFRTLPAGTKRVTFWITYTRGAAGGGASFRVSYQSSTLINARAGILDQSTLLAAQPEGNVNFYQETLRGPQPADANPIIFELTFIVPADCRGVQLSAAEYGVPGTPGTIAMSVSADG